jgi:hypothetical protein
MGLSHRWHRPAELIVHFSHEAFKAPGVVQNNVSFLVVYPSRIAEGVTFGGGIVVTAGLHLVGKSASVDGGHKESVERQRCGGAQKL